MKRLLWLGLLAVLPISIASADQQQSSGIKQSYYEKQPLDNSQNGPLGMFYLPKWYGDAIVAANCYQTGMHYLTSDPKLAVEAFELGLNYARKAAAEGGGQELVSLSRGLSKELQIADAIVAKSKADNDKSNDSSSKNDGSADKDSNNNDNNQDQSQAQPVAPKVGVISSHTQAGSYHLGSGSLASTGTRSRSGM